MAEDAFEMWLDDLYLLITADAASRGYKRYKIVFTRKKFEGMLEQIVAAHRAWKKMEG